MDYKHWLLQRYHHWRSFLPARWLYHADYFLVQQLLAADRHVIAKFAEQRLRQVLGAALQHVPFYRRSVRLTARQLAHEPLADLMDRFPYIGKTQVMDCQHDFLDERKNTRWLLYAASTGSSGQCIGMWRSKRLTDIEKAFYTHEWKSYGFSFHRSRYLRIGAEAVRPATEPPTRTAGNRLLLSPYHLSAANKAVIVSELNRFRPEYLHGYPSCVAALAELIEPCELDFQLRAVLLGSEPLMPLQAAPIQRLFDCPISISYGLTERTNLAFSDWAGEARSPYRFQPLYGWNENRSVDGQAEIVGTSLWNDLMPLIRYCTGDFGLIDSDGCCPAIDGRAQEFVVDRYGNRIPGLSIMINADSYDYVRVYQVRQSQPGQITIAVVPRHGRLTREQRQQLLDIQVKYWGPQFDIGLDEVDDIPASASGKRQFVVSSGACA